MWCVSGEGEGEGRKDVCVGGGGEVGGGGVVNSYLNKFALSLVNSYSTIFSSVNSSSFGQLVLILVNSSPFWSTRSHAKYD